MHKDLISGLVAVVVFTLVLGVAYPLVVTGVSQVAFGNKADGSLIKDAKGKVTGSTLIGQDFGTVTVNQDHVRLLRVQNVAGGAEGQVLVSIDHPNLRLKQPDAVVFVQPGGVCDVPVSPQQARRMRSASCAYEAV